MESQQNIVYDFHIIDNVGRTLFHSKINTVPPVYQNGQDICVFGEAYVVETTQVYVENYDSGLGIAHFVRLK